MHSQNPKVNGVHAVKNLDILVIGAGFGGIYSLYKFRKLGYNIHVFEAGTNLGGVWHWNTYPGARVDSDIPYYQLSMPEIWRKWNWSERFPGGEEIQAYFKFVDKTLNLSKDITYSATVVDASYDEATAKWTVTTENGHKAVCRYLICATGSSFKPHYPVFNNLDAYKGKLVHSTRWDPSLDAKDKNVAIIGSGATAIQCTQELAKQAKNLTVYIRTVSISLPMFQRPLSEFEQRVQKSVYGGLFTISRNSFSGLGYDPQPGSVTELSDEEREERWEELWNSGGFNFLQSNYRDFLVDIKANRMMYDFWAEKTRPRIKNAAKADFLVPKEPPFAFGTKGSSMEQDYYECCDRDNVELMDLKANPIREFTERGIISQDGQEREFDIVVMATGFDAMTGSLTNMNIQGTDGLTFRERWRDGVFTHLGLCSVAAQTSPTAFTNGPVFIEVQVDMLVDLFQKLKDEGIKSIEAQREAEEKWKQAIQDSNAKTLMPLTDSWYMGANIPGKKREQLNYLKGIANYEFECREALSSLNGFTVIHEDKQ